MQRIWQITKTILAWSFSAFFFLFGLVYIPSWSTVLFLLAVLLLLPPLKRLRERFLKKPLQIILIAATVFMAIIIAPQATDSKSATTEQMAAAVTTSTPDATDEAGSGETLVAAAPVSTIPVTLAPLPTDTHTPAPTPTVAPTNTPIPTEAPTPTPTETPVPTATPIPTPPPDSLLAVHFIDVGQGDAILIICDGHAMLIDGGPKENGQRVISYLKKQKATRLDYVVNTHPHEDHTGGLAGVVNACAVEHAYVSVTEHDGDAFRNFAKYAQQKDLAIKAAHTGDVWMLGSAIVEVLSCNVSQIADNDASIVLMITHGDVSYLLMGDATELTEQALLQSGCDLDADVLKVGHHGGDDATGYRFLREVMPEYAVITVGKGNAYGHPTEAVLSKLSDADANICRTDLNGDVVFTDDGKTVSIQVARDATKEALLTLQPDEEQEPESKPIERAKSADALPASGNYIGNRNSKKFHYPSCHTLPDEKNRVYFDSRDEATSSGYKPCKNCDP